MILKVGLMTADIYILPMIYYAFVQAVLLCAIGTTQC